MMKLSDFVMIYTKGEGPLDWEYFAEVSVTTGWWLWKKVERRKIHREYGRTWHFLDTGEFTPGFEADQLERAYKAQESLNDLLRSSRRSPDSPSS